MAYTDVERGIADALQQATSGRSGNPSQRPMGADRTPGGRRDAAPGTRFNSPGSVFGIEASHEPSGKKSEAQDWPLYWAETHNPGGISRQRMDYRSGYRDNIGTGIALSNSDEGFDPIILRRRVELTRFWIALLCAFLAGVAVVRIATAELPKPVHLPQFEVGAK